MQGFPRGVFDYLVLPSLSLPLSLTHPFIFGGCPDSGQPRLEVKMIDVKELIDKQCMDDEEEHKRAKEPIESFHSSSVCYCARQIFLSKIHAKTFDLATKKKMAVGSALHHQIQWYKNIKDNFDIEVPVKYQVEGSPVFLVGSADLVAKDKSCVVDIKSINGFSFVKTAPSQEHLVQLNVYMKCLGISEGQILYVNKTDMDMISHNWKYNELVFEATVRKVLMVYEALKKWENDGAYNNPIPFPKCKSDCFACRTEMLFPEIQKIIKEM